jgi:hypothetical protein
MGIDMCPPVDCRNALFRQPEEEEMNEKAAFDEGGFYYSTSCLESPDAL